MTQGDPLDVGSPGTEPVAPAAQPATEVPDASGLPETPAAPEAPASPAATPGTDWKARFDGLMSEHQKVLAKAAELERSKLTPEERVQAEESDLKAQMEQLQAQFAVVELDRAKESVLSQYPKLAPFADLIYAETAEEMLELAKDLNARLEGLGAPAPATPAATGPAAPVAPVSPGSPAFQGPGVDALEAAKETARKGGGWGEYLRVKGMLQELQGQGQ